ncbi:TPA: hypothetical protein ACR3Z0_006455 [Bacillus thuringiensis]|uniref:Zn-finger protein n=9 Tax=root TaxID=1 RepID=I7ILV9_9CAUD|nr:MULTISPECIES: hypothetical protein [Bacillus cereus group]YP_006488689.1 hypothetical protein BTCS33_gp19 [Bacillus phage BtCS33]YP_006560712.1 Zn-finger protein [Staphylococcus phage SpaA1]YP_009829835.1 Zn-finger protein [Bacillus phage BceA1]ALN97358.1 hypothetical protein XO27_0019 [Bacillus phage phi4I1]AUO78581.1 hypothetical protein XO27_0019 [Bacillus phage BtiUFT6.51-F]AFL46410.1 hypothetical protein BtCS33_19 [Bacillus phage BtCS33]AGE76384.1 hypothetical protein HD73_0805 [Baci
MELRKTADGESFIIELEEKKSSTANQLKRVIYFLIGSFGLLISVVLCFTIIGILPGLGLTFFSALFIYSALGKQLVKCPNCNKKQPVVHKAEGFVCRRCNKRTLVEWKK